jgi:hypothetical protein
MKQRTIVAALLIETTSARSLTDRRGLPRLNL